MKKITYVTVAEREKKSFSNSLIVIINPTVALIMTSLEAQPFWRHYCSLNCRRTTVSMQTTVTKYSCNMKIYTHRMANFLDTWYDPKDVSLPNSCSPLQYGWKVTIAGLPQRATYYHATAILVSGRSFLNQNLKSTFYEYQRAYNIFQGKSLL